jgi:hypothetical protein
MVSWVCERGGTVADWSCFGSVIRFTLKPSLVQALTREWTLPKVSSIQTSPFGAEGEEAAMEEELEGRRWWWWWWWWWWKGVWMLEPRSGGRKLKVKKV